ncbi:hypothetical protein M2280_006303 [Prescottella agglutinans]|uniref:Uncharacterized protein n=1 Tax=Prescottella agglutinans TaxID=1644129 RepID=A0ABT6MMY4_9NOCA|nr:hypothetical protein [Prescottella agglutinans]
MRVLQGHRRRANDRSHDRGHQGREPLRYGLSDARLFTTIATVEGEPDSTFSTLTGVGQYDGRVLAGQFTTHGKVEGAVINVAGNWWNILACKALNEGQQQ